MGDILAVIKAIPVIVGLVKEIFHWFKMHVGDGDPIKFIADVGEGFQKLNQAKSPKEKQDAARAIQDLIRRT